MKKIHVLATMLASIYEGQPKCRENARPIQRKGINITKPYKPRRLKQDPASRMARKLTEIRSRDPEYKRKQREYRKEYERKNKMALEKRGEFVRKQKKMMGWD